MHDASSFAYNAPRLTLTSEPQHRVLVLKRQPLLLSLFVLRPSLHGDGNTSANARAVPAIKSPLSFYRPQESPLGATI